MDLSKEYKDWIVDLKNKVRSAQLKAAVVVNSALIEFYWELGKSINEKQTKWGSKFLENLSKDLQDEFPEMKGFSVSNLKTCRLFYQYFSNGSQAANLNNNENSLSSGNDENIIRSQAANDLNEISNHPVLKIPWGHIKVIITKIKNTDEATFYIHQTIENNWSRDILDLQIKSNLYERKGKAVSNFKYTLPQPLSDLATQTLKDPYIFDFLSLDINYRERDIEKQLIQHISKFLLELGKGFAFVGNQYPLQVAD